jgi:TonB family protein
MKTCPVCDTPYPNQHNTCPTDGAVLIESRELAPGHIVRGKYRIVSKLGQGGMGVVYLAEHRLLGGKVALKFLAVELSRNPQFVKRFRNEARAAYQLHHPNIVEVTDLDQDEDASLFIAMEYVAGPNLRSVLREAKGPLPVARALHIARGVAAGLAAAHARGAVHRDIKPENILLTVEPDGGEHAKVLDFGIAVMTENVTNLSRTHGLLLTPEYAAPEQWRGTPAAELDGRTDLYALGGLLYEMLAGRTPFRAVNPEGWMFQHIQGVPEPLGLLRPDLAKEHSGLEEVVMRLLAREREQRFPSAAALLEALAAKPPATHPEPDVRPAVTPHPAAVAKPPMAKPATEAAQPTEVTESFSQQHPARDVRPAVTPHPAAVAKPPMAKPATEAAQPTAVTESETFSQRRTPEGTLWAVLILGVLIVAGLGIGLATVIFWSTPTPITAVPVLTPAGGTYFEPQPVTISDATPHSNIHYTVDGSSPTEFSRRYSQPIDALPSGAVIRAMATADGHKPSPDVTGVYIWSAATKPAPTTQVGSAYDQGKDAYEHKNYAQARTLFAQACDAGELRACNYLGFLLAEGLGGAKDVEKARPVYQNACDGGNLSSCAGLGSLYENAGNNAEARKYFKKACDAGLPDGCILLHDIGAKANSQLPSTAETMPQVLDDPTLRDNRARLDDLRRQLSNLSITLTPQNPKIQQLKAQIADLEQQSAQQPNKIIAGRTSTGAPPKKLSISSGVMAANLVEKTVPQYPAVAKAARIQGTVVLEATISKTGTIENLRVISGPPLLQRAALDAVSSWRYKPYLLNGEAVEVETTVNVVFNLGG